jgi:hypothetical protein
MFDGRQGVSSWSMIVGQTIPGTGASVSFSEDYMLPFLLISRDILCAGVFLDNMDFSNLLIYPMTAFTTGRNKAVLLNQLFCSNHSKQKS